MNEARAGCTVDLKWRSGLFPPDGAVVFALWFSDVSSLFAARAESEVTFHVVQEFRC